METAGVVHQQDPGHAIAEMDDGDGGRIHHHALELIEVRAGEVGDQDPDEVAVRAHEHQAARMSRDDPLDLVEDASLRLEEALAGGE